MLMNKAIRIAGLCLALTLPALCLAEQWHFVVKNKTESRITKLEVSENGQDWGNFDIGDGIGPGERATLVWAASTNDEKCHQWIRAKFHDGSWSEPTKQNFCKDLDDPIEFTE